MYLLHNTIQVTNSMKLSQISDLPFELRQRIIEIAVFDSEDDPTRATMVTLLAVCSQFRSSVELIKYKHISLTNQHDVDLFLKPLHTQHKLPNFYGTTVKSLCITYNVPPLPALQALSICKGIHALAFWIGGDSSQILDPAVISIILNLQLRSLSFYIQAFLPWTRPDPDFGAIPNIKYLNICDRSNNWKAWSWRGISSLTNLTHISLSNIDGIQQFSALECLLQNCKPLLVCLVRMFDYVLDGPNAIEELNKILMEIDIRFVAVLYPQPVQNWSKHVRGEVDEWMEAEKIIAQRRLPNRAGN
jgi:hypothetical protein